MSAVAPPSAPVRVDGLSLCPAQRRAGRRGRELLARAGRDPRPRGRVGQRQDDDGARAARLHAARRGVAQRHASRSAASRSRGRDERALRSLRGRVVSYVPQDPGGALNPSLRVGDAILDVLRAHRAGEGSAEVGARGARARRARRRRGLHAPLSAPALGRPAAARHDRHGLRLRAARGRARRAYDRARRAHAGSHPVRARPPAAASRAWRWSTSRTTSRSSRAWPTASWSCTPGRVVEDAAAADVIERPRHPYTRALVAAIPDFRHPRSLRGIPGVSVGVGEWPAGCSFAPRCEHAADRCLEAVPGARRRRARTRGALLPRAGAGAVGACREPSCGRAPRPRRPLRCSR